MDAIFQSPPHSIEAEQGVLGGLLISNDSWELIAGTLEASDFYTGQHREIFKTIEELAKRQEPFDLVTLPDQAAKLGFLKQDSDSFFSYIAELCYNVPSIANIEAYRDIVKERSILRRLMSIGHECTRLAASREASSDDVREEIEQKLFAIANDGAKADFANIPEVIKEIISDVEANLNSDDGLVGLCSGLKTLNDLTGGFEKSDLIVLAGRPSMGKTALAMRFMAAALEKLPADKTVQFYSLEMPRKQIVNRMMCMTAGVSMHRFKRNELDEHEWSLMSVATSKVNEMKSRWIIDDEASITPIKLRSKARRGARLYGHPGLIVVDYLQLMRSSKSRVENRNLEIAEISAALKSLAKEMDCPVIALSQLNRAVENRPNKRPHNGDLRESGAIEQDADLIMFVYRDEVYHHESEDKGIAEIIIGKNRNGPTGTARTAFIGECTSFQDLAPNQYQTGLAS